MNCNNHLKNNSLYHKNFNLHNVLLKPAVFQQTWLSFIILILMNLLFKKSIKNLK